MYAGAGALVFGFKAGAEAGASFSTVAVCSAKFAMDVMRETLGNIPFSIQLLSGVLSGLGQVAAGGAQITEGAYAINTAVLTQSGRGLQGGCPRFRRDHEEAGRPYGR